MPYSDSQFPDASADQYFAQLVPNAESTLAPNESQKQVDGFIALLDQIGPALLMVHSGSGPQGLAAAIAHPELVKVVVPIEPRSCPVSDSDIRSVFTRLPVLTIFGDRTIGNPTWEPRMSQCQALVQSISGAGGRARHLNLPISESSAIATCS